MYPQFYTIFSILSIVSILLQFVSRGFPSHRDGESSEFRRFQTNWLVVYYIVMCADWLQGPYIYALYTSYGFSKAQIGVLFISGYLSSLVFGTFVGGLADKYGRKTMCVGFSLLYTWACILKIYNNFIVLLIGRFFGGIATSLLHSSFEAWMVSEHFSRKFFPELLAQTFSKATFGNGIVAVIAGVIASLVAENTPMGYLGPFIVALVPLLLSMGIVLLFWDENYGDTSLGDFSTLAEAYRVIRSDNVILLLGCVQSLFEASMYTFVFMWTPTLVLGFGESNQPPYGIIFACFMVCIMIGSAIFELSTKFTKVPPEVAIKNVLALAGVSLFVPVLFTNPIFTLASFFVFEVCCGIYFPCIALLRSVYIPEATRVSVMCLFRIPLNALVVILLANVGNIGNSTVFFVCCTWLLVAFILQSQLEKNTRILRF